MQKKTIVLELPDDFKFPEKYGDYNCQKRVELINGENITERYSSCDKCIFEASNEEESWCGLNLESIFDDFLCPFYKSDNVRIKYTDDGYPYIEK